MMMAASLCNVNRFKKAALGGVAALLLALLLCPRIGAEQPFLVAPVKRADEVRVLPVEAWPPPESEGGAKLAKLFYVRGILDALQYMEVAPEKTAQVLEKLKGLNLNQILALMDRFYLTDPRRAEVPPAAVILRILPDQEKQD